MAKVKINTEWLSGCGGCHVAIVDLHERLLDVLGSTELQHSPVLTDIKGYPPADVGIVTGAVRNENDRHHAEQMRAACKTIIAFGTCAVYGGIPAAALVHSREEILDVVYRNNPTTRGDAIPNSMVPPLEKLVTPLDEVIPIDLYLPGCPPHANFIFDALISLVNGRTPKAKDETVCAHCQRRMEKSEVTQLKDNHEGIPEDDVCFLSQGYLCLGSTTLDRCLAPCPNNGVMCTGCAGPSRQILTEPNRDIRTEIGDRLARLTQIPRADAIDVIERQAKTHYSYAMATKMIGNKPTFLIEKWIADIEKAESGA